MNLQIRPALSTDKDFILSLTTRFSDFDLPEWRAASEVDSTNYRLLQKALDQPEPESAVFVAEAENGKMAGFIHLETEADFFDGLFMPYMFYNGSQPVQRMLLKGIGPVLLLTGLPVILILFAPLACSLRANLGILAFLMSQSQKMIGLCFLDLNPRTVLRNRAMQWVGIVGESLNV